MTEEKKASRPAKKKAAKTVRITLVRSPIGETYRHKATLSAMGFHKLHQTVEQADTPQLRGMLAKVAHLVRIETADATGKEKAK
jgi:large subunit ribosomal protein L30